MRFELGPAVGVEVEAPFHLAEETGGEFEVPPVRVRVLTSVIPGSDPRLLGTGRPQPMEWCRTGSRLSVRGRTFLANADLADMLDRPVLLGVIDWPEGFHESLSNLCRLVMGLGAFAEGTLLLHSSVVIMKGRAILFYGHSGAGKSTVGRLALEAGFDVASDDLNLVCVKGAERAVVQAFPWSGSYGPRFWRSIPAYPLWAVVQLEKSDENRLQLLPRARALSSLCSCAPFMNTEPDLYGRLFDILETLVGQVPAYRLEFRRDGSFWPLVAEAVLQAS